MSPEHTAVPQVRAAHPNIRATHAGAVLLAIGCCLSAVSGQALEKTVYLPDSLGVVAYPEFICCDPDGRLAYVSGLGEYVLAIDGTTHEPRSRILVGGAVGPLCTNPTGSKLFVGDRTGHYLVIVDVGSGAVTSRIPLGGTPNRLFWLASRGKLYVSTDDAPGVAVVDPLRDSLLTFLPFGSSPGEFCSDSSGEKVYCADASAFRVAVIDADADTLLDSVSIRDPYGMCLNPNSGRLYCSSEDRDLYVIDTHADTIVAGIRTGRGSREVCYNPIRNKVYSSVNASRVSVVDCDADTVLSTISLFSGATELLYVESGDKVYCAGSGTAVISCSSDSVKELLPTGDYTSAYALDPDSNTVYCVSRYGRMSVVDVASDSVVARVATGSRPSAVCFVASVNKAYAWYRVNDEARVAVIDGTTQAVLRHIDMPDSTAGGAPRLCVNPDLSKVYIGVDGRLLVVDAQHDSLIRDLALACEGVGGMVCSPVNDRLYLTGTDPGTFAIVDCYSDSLVREESLGEWLAGPGYNPDLDRIYLHEQSFDSGWVDVIDCTNDSVIARTSGIITNGGAMCYNPENHMLYDVDAIDSFLALIDCKTNQMLGYIEIFPNPSDACCGPLQNKVYISSWIYGIAVVDGRTHRMVDSIESGYFANDIMYVPASDRVYCAGEDVYVAECASDSVIARIPANATTFDALCLDSVGCRIYVANEGGSSVLVIRDSVAMGMAEGAIQGVARSNSGATVIRGMLFLDERPDSSLSPSPSTGCLLDISGRKVMDLRPGANDVRVLAPGVYFVRERGVSRERGGAGVRKVVVTR